MKKDLHKQLISKAPYGFAYHKIILDNDCKPVDYVFLEINEAFEKLTGLKSCDIIDKTVKAVIPGIEKDTFDWIAFYGEIAMNGGERDFEQYSEKLNRWYKVQVYSPEKYYFATLFIDITSHKEDEEKIINSQLLLKASLESQKDTILFSIDHNYRYLYYNQAHADAMKYAYGAEVEAGKNILDYISNEDDRKTAKENYDRAMKGESHSNIRHYGDLHVDYYESFFNPIVNETNEIIGATGMARNISARVSAEERLLESEQRLSSIYNAVGAVIFQLAVEAEGKYRFVSINHAFLEATGLGQEQVVGKLVNEVIPEPSLTMVLEKYKQAIGEKRIIRWEETSVYPTGEVTGEVSIAPLFSDKGRCTYLVGSVLDITGRKRVERELMLAKKKAEEGEIRLKMAQLVSSAGTWDWNIVDNTFYWSEEFRKIFGFTDKTIAGFESWTGALHPDDVETASRRIQESMDDHTELINDYRVVLPDKSIRWIRALGRTFYDGEKPVRMIGLCLDFTQQKAIEKELIQAKETAEKSERLKSAFLANMSHEIRTPMNGILGFAELLKEPHLTGEEQQKYIRIIEKSGFRMLNILNDIIDISKIESGQMEISYAQININEKFEEIRALFRPEAGKRKLELILTNRLSTSESLIRTDPDKLYAILTNLVKNAIKFTIQGHIELGCEKKGAFLEFFVKDTGIGISHQQKGIIFERFRQGSDLTGRYNEGAGLGLSIAKAYVEMLGGNIRVESESGKGSSFYFTIPCEISEGEILKSDIPIDKTEGGRGRKLKILIAEDDESSQILISLALRKFAKEILTSTTGAETVDVCSKNPDLDLVLLDIRMTEMDGHEAARRIRQFNNKIVIIAQTAYALAGDRQKALESGCNDYLSKPVSVGALQELIAKHFR